jgi:hypothetical protein
LKSNTLYYAENHFEDLLCVPLFWTHIPHFAAETTFDCKWQISWNFQPTSEVCIFMKITTKLILTPKETCKNYRLECRHFYVTFYNFSPVTCWTGSVAARRGWTDGQRWSRGPTQASGRKPRLTCFAEVRLLRTADINDHLNIWRLFALQAGLCALLGRCSFHLWDTVQWKQLSCDRGGHGLP